MLLLAEGAAQSVPHVLLVLAAALAAAKALGEVAERFGQPAVIGELLAGVALGPSVLAIVDPGLPVLHVLAEIGVIILLFQIGLETDLRRLISGPATMLDPIGLFAPRDALVHHVLQTFHRHPLYDLVLLRAHEDGVEAMEFLRRAGRFRGVPRPDIILLDLNLPRKDGREVLQEIKSDDDLKRIPVVVLTTSKAEEDVLRTYNLHANCYVTKPVDLEKFMVVVKTIDSFWLTVVTLPPTRDA